VTHAGAPQIAPLRSGFGASSTATQVAEGHDLTGRSAVVTGATSGIGIETARALASARCTVVLGVRDMKRGAQIARDISEYTGNNAVYAMPLDLSDFASVKEFAENVRAELRALKYLINNAGIADMPERRNREGFELHFATNHLGHHLLFESLLQPLRRSEGARVVSLTSAAHRRSGIDFDDIHFQRREYDSYVAYAQSKTATSLFAVAANQRFSAEGIHANAVMPGMIVTGLIKDLTPERLHSLRFTDETGQLRDCVKSLEQGAATTLWAALSPDLEGVGGHYLEDCGFAAPWSRENMHHHPWAGYVPHAVAPDAAHRLWEVTREMVSG
jgi:NAD(P)-dependent dehydrogenase (short-subunit alcohol dehydrogenase family)